MDKLATQTFKQGKDISFIISVADWTQHTFRSSRNLDMIIKKHQLYHMSKKEGFFNLNNAVIVFENFFKFMELPEKENSLNQEGEKRYEDEIKNAYLTDLAKISIHLYCYNKMLNNLEEIDISLKWFKRFFEEIKFFYNEKKQANDYWSYQVLEMLGEILKVSKKISIEDSIVSILLSEAEIYLEKIWKKNDYIVKNKLFKPVKVDSDSFRIVEFLINKTVSEDDIFESIRNEIKNENIEDKEKVIYFLEKYWYKLTLEECDLVLNFFIKDITPYNDTFYLIKPLMSVITPLEKVIKLFESKFLKDEVKLTKAYKECYSILCIRKLSLQLQEKLELKKKKEKTLKI